MIIESRLAIAIFILDRLEPGLIVPPETIRPSKACG